MNDVIVGGTYRHYKQGLYRVLNVALLESTHEELVIYECLYPNDVAQIWARPKADFSGHVAVANYEGPRFAPVLNAST